MAGRGRILDSDLIPGLDLWYVKKSGFWEILNYWRDTGEKSKPFLAWGALYLFVFFLPLLFCGVWGPIQTQPNLENLTLMILNPLAWAQTIIKFSVLWMGIEKQSTVLELMKPNFLTCIPRHKKADTDRILAEATIFANKLVNIGILTEVITCVYWDLLPILRSEFMRCTLGITIFGYTPPPGHNKILGYWFPVDVDSNPWTQIIYVYEFTIINLAGFMVAIIQGLIVHLVLLFNAQTEILSYLLSDMKKSDGTLNQGALLAIIKDHQRLLTYGQYMRDLFNIVVTFQMSTGLLILIITIFNFFLSTKNVDFVIMLKMISFLAYTFVEATVYCYVGSRMEEMSRDIGFAAYSSEWYNQGVEFRKTVQMIMVRSQSPMVLQFGRMYPINLVALMSLLQCAYSTAMFMNNMVEGQ